MKRIKQILPIMLVFMIVLSTTVGAATVFNSKDITYSSSATSKKNVKEALDELYTKANTPWSCASGWYCYKQACPDGSLCRDALIKNVQLGDYISMTPTAASYSISTSITGYTSAQTIKPNELNLWRVIKKNADGTVDVVSEYVSSTDVYFKGQTGYKNYVGALNTIAAQYTNTKYVNKTRMIGYSNQTELLTTTDKLTSTSAPWKKDTALVQQLTECDTTTYLCGTDEDKGGGDIGYIEDYNLVKGVYGTMVATTPSGTKKSYSIASRYYAMISTSNWDFRVRFINTSGGIAWNAIRYYGSGSFVDQIKNYGVRPVLTLKATISIKGGAGIKNSPYTLS